MELENLLDDCKTTEPSAAVQGMIDRSQQLQMDNRDFAHLLVMWDNYRSSMLSFFNDYDLLISPVNTQAAPLHETVLDAADYSYTSAYNLAGWPGVVIRGGSSAEGLAHRDTDSGRAMA